MATQKSQMILLFALVFALFYLSVFGDICVVDDSSNMIDIANGQANSLREIFYPRVAGGGYYRPLIGLSYLINLRLWDLDSRTLHLENVLLHAANAVMVYLLARALLARQGREGGLAPLCAGLLFGLHPIVTESVDWISGRTDLIAGFFVLLAALLLVRHTRKPSGWLIAGAALSVLVGLLGKETALGFVPGAIFLLAARREGEEPVPDAGQATAYRESLLFLLCAGGCLLAEIVFFNFWCVLVAAPAYLLVRHSLLGGTPGAGGRVSLLARRFAGYAAALMLAVGIFFGIRGIVFTSNLPRIPQTIKLMLQDFNYTLHVFLGGTGFYVKKFFFPLPLNFAIREIDPAYALAGTVICFVALFFTTRRTMASSLALAGAFLFAPALPLALGTVAWTAYAERYIYISAAFWSVALVIYLAPRWERFGRAGVAAVALVLVAMGGITLQRNQVWLTSLTLMRDTVKVSPSFREVHVIYMSELVKAGDLPGAREQYRLASALPAVGYNERLDLLMAEVCLQEGKENDALGYYRKILEKTRGNSSSVRQRIAALLQGRVDRSRRPDQHLAAAAELARFVKSAPAEAAPPARGAVPAAVVTPAAAAAPRPAGPRGATL